MVTSRRERFARLRALAARMAAVAADAAVLAGAYLAALAFRLDFGVPQWGWRAAGESYLTFAAVHLVSLWLWGCYRLPARRTGVRDLPRFIGATAAASAVLFVLRALLPGVEMASVRPPYSVAAMAGFFAAAGVIGVRALYRLAWEGGRRTRNLLARETRRFDNRAAAGFFAGRTVLVTGAGGTIGAEIVRQLAAAGARQVLMVERSENALYEIDRELRDPRCRALMLDVNDRERMAEIFAEYRPSVVLHAAAYKHVPMVELNPREGWRNNCEATAALAELAERFGIERFVLISTDKAVRPVSVMGKTKREAEKSLVRLNAGGSRTSFCAVRFGNVFGSSGSVVPLFREQIAKGGPVTVTHPEMRRYFMTLSEAVSLVLQAASRTERAIYTLDMGKPVGILELAEGMIESAGWRPYVDIPIVFTGVRPGEKLFEEIDVSEKSFFRTDMAKIYITGEAGEET